MVKTHNTEFYKTIGNSNVHTVSFWRLESISFWSLKPVVWILFTASSFSESHVLKRHWKKPKNSKEWKSNYLKAGDIMEVRSIMITTSWGKERKGKRRDHWLLIYGYIGRSCWVLFYSRTTIDNVNRLHHSLIKKTKTRKT